MLNLLIKPLWIVVEMSVHNTLGNEIWGTYAALLSFSVLFIVLADLGINQYLTKTLAGEPGKLKELYPNFFAVKIALLAIYPLLMLGAGWGVGYRGGELWILVLLCLMWGAHQLTAFFRANFQAMQRFNIDSFASIGDRVLLLILVAVLFKIGLSIENFVYARIIAAGLVAIISLFVLNRFYGWIAPKLNPKTLRTALTLSLPFALITILNSVHDKVDQVMLERIYGETETGIYAGAYRIMDMTNMYLWTILAIFLARFAFFGNNTKELSKLLSFGQIIVAFPMIFVSVFVFFYGEKLLFMYSNFSEAEISHLAIILKILFISAFTHSLWVIYGTLLSVTDHLRFVNIIIAISIILNVSLNLVFIPQYGGLAAAWTTVTSFVFLSFCYVLYVHFKTKVDVPWLVMAKLLLAAAILGGSFYAGKILAIEWYLNVLISGLVYLLSGFALKLIEIKKLKGMLNK